MQEYPYLTKIFLKKTNEYAIALIQAITKNYISYYSLKSLKPMDKESFLRLTENWWKKSPNLPISIYYQELFDRFNYCKKHLPTTDYQIVAGFDGIKLKNLSEKRIKRKIIHIEDGKK